MADAVQARAKSAFSFSPDGVTTRDLKPGEVVGMSRDIFIGLHAAGMVEEAPGAEPSPPEPTTAAGIVDPVSLDKMTTERTELSPEAAQELAAIRAEDAPRTARPQPDIEPVEHGGDSIDRVLTRGADGDAVAVENTDVAAQAGKAAAAQEVAQEIEKAPEPPEGKMAEPPENKAEPKARRSRKSQSAE